MELATRTTLGLAALASGSPLEKLADYLKEPCSVMGQNSPAEEMGSPSNDPSSYHTVAFLPYGNVSLGI